MKRFLKTALSLIINRKGMVCECDHFISYMRHLSLNAFLIKIIIELLNDRSAEGIE